MATVHDLVVLPQTRPLSGSVPVPADERVGQLALIVAALAQGTSEIKKLARTEQVGATRLALATLGVSIEDAASDSLRIRGIALSGLSAPGPVVSCGNSISTLRMLAGVLAAQPFRAVLVGGPATARAGMARLAAPLRLRGAQIEGIFSTTEVGEVTPPLIIGPLPPRQRLSQLDHELAIPSSQVKEALLFSGLYADGPTYIRERIVSRDHLERMLQALDVPLATAGPLIELDIERWDANLPAFTCEIPGDFSAALVLLAAATLVPGSRVCARATGLNPTRTGSLDLLRQMGGAVDLEVHAHQLGEPRGTICASYAALRGATMTGEVVARAIDDVPILAALAARARGPSEISGLAELTDEDGGLLTQLLPLLRAFGVECRADGAALFIEGRSEGPLLSADVDCQGDARLALSGALLALLADGPSRIRRVDSLPLRFPRFFAIMRALGADLRLEERAE